MRIKAQDQETEKLTVNFPKELYADVLMYRQLLGPKTKTNYVIVEAVRGFLASDRDFRAAKAKLAGAAGNGSGQADARSAAARVASPAPGVAPASAAEASTSRAGDRRP